MALSYSLHTAGLHVGGYDQASTQLEATGAGAPTGRLHQVALESSGEIPVFVLRDAAGVRGAWRNARPDHGRLAADPGEPMAAQVHNPIEG